MRTTIQLPDELLAQAKQAAAASRRTLTQVIEDALRAALARRNPREHQPFDWPSFYGEGGLMPGVDLDDSAALEAFGKGISYVYEGYSDTISLVELDEEPPQPIDQENIPADFF